MRFEGYAKLDLGDAEGKALVGLDADTFHAAAAQIARQYPTCCAILQITGKGIADGTHVALHIRRGQLCHFGTTLGPLQ